LLDVALSYLLPLYLKQDAERKAAEQRTTQQNQNQPVTNNAPSPLPPDPSRTIVQQTGPTPSHPSGQTWVRSDYEVSSTSTEQVPGGTKTTMTITPKPQTPTMNLTSVEEARQHGMFGENYELPLSGFFGSKPILDTSAKRTATLEVISLVALPIAGPALIPGLTSKGIIAGEAIGAVFNIAPKAYQASQGQPVSLVEYSKAGLEGAVLGGAFAVVGGAATLKVGQAIGGNIGKVVTGVTPLGDKAVPLAPQIIGLGTKTAVNVGLGAGGSAAIEYAETGKVTQRNVIAGGAFGAIFTGGTELIGVGGPAIQGKIRSTSAGQKLQEQVNQYYQYSSESLGNARQGNQFHLSVSQKILGKVTGIEPQRPQGSNVIGLKTVETADPKKYIQYNVTSTKDVDSAIIIGKRSAGTPFIEDIVSSNSLPSDMISNKASAKLLGDERGSNLTRQQSKDIIDMIPFKEEISVTKSYKAEMADAIGKPNSVKDANMRIADMLGDKGSVLYGRSEAPVPKEASMIEGNADLSKLGLNAEEIAGVKEQTGLTTKESLKSSTNVNIVNEVINSQKVYSIKGDFPEGKILDPSKMIKERSSAFKDLGMPKELETAKEFTTPSGARIGNFSKTPTKQYSSLKDLKRNIKDFPKLPKGDAYTDSMIKWKRLEGPVQEPQADFMGETKQPKGKPVDSITAQKRAMGQNAIALELTGKAEASTQTVGKQGLTGSEQYMEDLKLGSALKTTRAEQVSHPFRSFVGRPYYASNQRNNQTDEDAVYVNYPKGSGILQPEPIASPAEKVGTTRTVNVSNGLQETFAVNPTFDIGVGPVGLGNVGFTGISDNVGQSKITGLMFTPAFGFGLKPIQRNNPVPVIGNDTGITLDLGQGLVPESIVRLDVGQQQKPIQFQDNGPIQIFKPDNPISKFNTMDSSFFNFGGSKYEGSGLSLPGQKREGKSNKRIRYYPVVDPNIVFGAFF
jgi:hypothetical protein